MSSMPKFVAGFDSATAMVMSTAAYLRGEDWPALGNPPWLQPIAARANVLPKRAREQLFIATGASETVSPKNVADIDLNEVDEWLTQEYPARPYSTIAIGSSSGAGVNLNAALGAAWLPQTFLVPVRQQVHPDDPTAAMRKGTDVGNTLVANNPDWQLHHMHDANQDRLMVRALTYFRVKRRALGGYRKFIADRLQPGGTILLYACEQQWGTNRIGERHVFQHGAVGGATEEEFHHGSDRVTEYLERYDSPVRTWEGPQPDERSPEAEWGYEEALTDELVEFAREHGYTVKRIAYKGPDDISAMVADFYRWWYRRRSMPANRLMVTSFLLNDPYHVLRTGSVPYWMRFNMRPSLDGVHEYLDRVEDFDEIYLGLFQHGVEAVGVTTGDQWRDLLKRADRRGETLGADLDAFPRDFAHYGRYNRAMRKIPASHQMPGPIDIDVLDEFLASAPTYEGISVETLT